MSEGHPSRWAIENWLRSDPPAGLARWLRTLENWPDPDALAQAWIMIEARRSSTREPWLAAWIAAVIVWALIGLWNRIA
jgi:hypothetical protein